MKKLFLLPLLFITSIATAEPIVTDSTSTSSVITKSDTTTTVKSPPPTAIAPSINSMNSDICTVAYSGAVQTQVLGISGGGTVRDLNCERLKLSKTLYDMGMKVAAVSALCQDPRVYNAMEMAGTPCPYNGKIGNDAADLWKANPAKNPNEIDKEKSKNDTIKGVAWGAGIVGIIAVLLAL